MAKDDNMRRLSADLPQRRKIILKLSRITIFVGAVLFSYIAGRLVKRKQPEFTSNIMGVLPIPWIFLFDKTTKHCNVNSNSSLAHSEILDVPNIKIYKRPDAPPLFIRPINFKSFLKVVPNANIGTSGDIAISYADALKSDRRYKIDNEHANRIHAELLIQPAMLVHPNPQSVALCIASSFTNVRQAIGQVLNHSSTVQSITVFYSPKDQLLSQDEILYAMIPQNGPMLNFVDYTSSTEADTQAKSSESLFDVVIFDLDDDVATPADNLWRPGSMYWSNRLDPESGIFVTSLRGQWPHTRLRNLQKDLVKPGQYAKVTDYEMAVPSKEGKNTANSVLHYFAVAFPNMLTYAYWHMSEAEYILRLRQRHVDSREFHRFDGAIMTTLSYPTTASTLAFCQLEYGNDCSEVYREDYSLDPYLPNIESRHLQIKLSTLGEMAGRGIFTTVDIRQDSYLDLQTSCHAVRMPWTTAYIIESLLEENELAEEIAAVLEYYFDGYGFYDEPFGRMAGTVDSGILTFANHGCNSTFNIGEPFAGGNELTVIVDANSSWPEEEVKSIYHPMQERFLLFEETIVQAYRDIRAGEELFENYLSFGGSTYFEQQVQFLREQCQGGMGEVEKFQHALEHRRNGGITIP